MNSSKIASLFLVLTLTFMLYSIKGTNAAVQTITKVDPYQTVAQRGQQFTVNITVVNVQNLFGLDVKLFWNQSILTLLNIDNMLGVQSNPGGVLYSPLSSSNTTKPGEYSLIGYSIGQSTPSFNGTGVMVRLTFNVTGVGSSELALQTTLTDKPPIGGVSQPISHLTQSGYYSPSYKVHVAVSPSQLDFGGSVNVTGYVVSNFGVNVTVQYQLQNETAWRNIGNATTNSHGNYTLMWNPSNIGLYKVKAVTTIQNIIVESTVVNVSVNSPIHITAVSPSEIVLGENVSIAGYVKSHPNINVTVRYQLQNQAGWHTIANTTTNAQGNYTLVWKPPDTGQYQVEAFTTIHSVTVGSGVANVSVTNAFNPWLYIIIGIVVLAVIVIAAALWYRKIKKPKQTTIHPK